ncbi:MAG: glycine cleavage system aminomethyltransferase GcvT [Bacteroidales bacterium]|nr:glycine cleavage system aminomethyltransferase GcvT [Bacteroidales bacterium]
MNFSPLNQIHVDLGAKMIDFHGFYLPVEYSGIKEEHLAVRNTAGIFDISHMGEITVKGSNASEFLQYVCSNDINSLTNGKAQYNYFPNGKGGIVDDLIVYKIDDNDFFLVVNASNIEKDFEWLKANKFGDVQIENESSQYAQIALQGPKSQEILQKIASFDLSSIANFGFVYKLVLDNIQVLISRTGYTGAGGFELYLKKENAAYIWNTILKYGSSEGLMPIGLGARDTLRLEMGYCLYGNEIDDTTSPIEAGLGWITKSQKKSKMIDKEFLDSEMKKLPIKKLVGLEIIERGIPRTGYQVFDKNENLIGQITSGSISPITNKGIGIAYLKTDNLNLGDEVFVSIRNKMVAAKVKKFPLYQ